MLIVKSSKTCGDRSRVAGTRFLVQQVAVLYKEGLTAVEIVDESNFLTQVLQVLKQTALDLADSDLSG